MLECSSSGAYLARGKWIEVGPRQGEALSALGFTAAQAAAARDGTMAWKILQKHNAGGDAENLRLRFDALASHDITYVGIVQTARASGLEKFPIPYVLTNCHNSLCAVGGTINEDDHRFGLSAARKYGGIFVPPHLAVIHQYMREKFAGCGKMILGSDSHTRYGALGTLAVGEGGGELAKQLLGRTYDLPRPQVVAVYVTGAPVHGVGPQDVALELVGSLFRSGYVKNKIMEFVGPGIHGLSQDFRNGIDVMTTETTCLSSIWCTDEVTRRYLAVHGRAGDYRPLAPEELAWYDGVVTLDLSRIRPMIALPMHPSNVFTIEELNANAAQLLHECEENIRRLIGRQDLRINLAAKVQDGRVRADQGVIAGCAGGLYENLVLAAHILQGHTGGCGDYALSVYPASQPVMAALDRAGVIGEMIAAGVTIRTAFCGPCFGAGDVPANGALSIRHATRNFPNREGSKPGSGQLSAVALMDARSIAATTARGGLLTAATELDYSEDIPEYRFDTASYDTRVYQGYGAGHYEELLKFGPNIRDWPEMPKLGKNLLLKVAAYITDPVTTTDELIPSGETSSFRSNPLGLAEFTLSRKDPAYVGRAKAVQAEETERRAGRGDAELLKMVRRVPGCEALGWDDLQIASTIYAVKPGDGSAREQAASCQRVLGAGANIAVEYATKRYRSNLINWGMLPFLLAGPTPFGLGDYVLVPNAAAALQGDLSSIPAYVLGGRPRAFALSIAPLTQDERDILADGCLINYYRR